MKIRNAEFRRVATQGDLDRLLEAAQADGGHVVVNATHVLQEGERLVGYGAVPGGPAVTVPTVWLWMDSREKNPRRCLEVLRTVEDQTRRAGYKVMNLPCTWGSSFRPFLERLGYDYLGETGIYLKRL